MSRYAADFHFRLSPDLRQRLEAAREAFEVTTGDPRRQDPRPWRPSAADLVVAFLELGLDAVESGESIVHAPALKAKGIRQTTPNGREHLAPMASAETYATGEDPDEAQLLEVDARRIAEGDRVAVRGARFTGAEAAELIGRVGTVQRIHRKRADVTLRGRRKAVRLHVFDLMPAQLAS